MPIWVVIYLGLAVAGVMLLMAHQGAIGFPPSLRRVVTQIAFGVAALSPLAVGLLWFAFEYKDVTPTLVSGAIGGTVIALGWLVSFGFRQYELLELREQSRRDSLLALREEIFTVLETLEKTDWKQSSTGIQAKIATPPPLQTASSKNSKADKARAYFPFSSSESRPVIFETLAANLQYFDERTVRAVVRFYAEFNDLRCLIEDTKRDDFRALDPERRIAFHVQLTTQRRNTIFFALRAIFRINVVLGNPTPDNISRGKHCNTDIVLDKEGLV